MTGNNLSSQAASSPVLSTRGSLTAVFGMGTGGASQPSSPDLNGLFVFPPRQACVSLARHTSVCLRGARWPFLAASTKILVQLDGLFRFPCIRPENPHPFLQVLSDPQYRTEETTSKKLTRPAPLSNQALDGLVPVRSIHCCTYTPGLSTLSSSRRLTDLRHERSHLGVGFTLRCFQRLSDPDVATQRYAWRHNWYTIGPSTPVLSY